MKACTIFDGMSDAESREAMVFLGRLADPEKHRVLGRLMESSISANDWLGDHDERASTLMRLGMLEEMGLAVSKMVPDGKGMRYREYSISQDGVKWARRMGVVPAPVVVSR